MSNKKNVLIVLLLLITGSLIFAASRPSRLPAPADTDTAPQAGNPSTSTAAAMPGKYISYSSDIVANTTGTKILFFHAPWCPQCRSIEAGINAEGVPEGLTIIKVDYDTSQDLRRKYGVTLQTTFVKVDGQGNLISKYVAYDEPTFEAVKRNFL